MKARLEQALEAFRDGGLSKRKRRKIEQLLERDGEARDYLRHSESLGRAVREAWTDGPPCPSPERFLAAIRPELQQISAERAVRHQASWAGVVAPMLDRVREFAPRLDGWLRPLPVSLASAAAGLMLLLGQTPFLRTPLMQLAGVEVEPAEQASLQPEDSGVGPLSPASEPTVAAETVGFGDFQATATPRGDRSSAVYDVYQGDAGLLIYDGQDESPVLIFAIPDEDDDDFGDDSDSDYQFENDDLSGLPVQLGSWS